MKSERLPIEKAQWFILNLATRVYCDYGFSSKAQAMNEVSFLNAATGGAKALYAVMPSGPKPPPDLKVLKGGK